MGFLSPSGIDNVLRQWHNKTVIVPLREVFMLFSSNLFLFLFLPAVLLGYYVLPRRLRNLCLLAASLIFYAWGTGSFVFVMIGSILFNYLAALIMDRVSRQWVRKALLVAAVAGNLGILFVYKYLDFSSPTSTPWAFTCPCRTSPSLWASPSLPSRPCPM